MSTDTRTAGNVDVGRESNGLAAGRGYGSGNSEGGTR